MLMLATLFQMLNLCLVVSKASSSGLSLAYCFFISHVLYGGGLACMALIYSISISLFLQALSTLSLVFGFWLLRVLVFGGYLKWAGGFGIFSHFNHFSDDCVCVATNCLNQVLWEFMLNLFCLHFSLPCLLLRFEKWDRIYEICYHLSVRRIRDLISMVISLICILISSLT